MRDQGDWVRGLRSKKMTLRLWRRVRVAPGRGVNASRGDLSLSIGRRGAWGMSRCLLKLSKRSLRIEIYAASAI